MNRAFLPATLLASALAMTPTMAKAGQASATMPVTLTVQPACRVSASPLAFAGDAGHAIEAEARIAVACNGDTPLAITLDGGAHPVGGERRLADADGSYVAYDLYSDPAHQSVWFPGQPMSATARDGRVELAAYGRVEADATLTAGGNYADTIAVTVDF